MYLKSVITGSFLLPTILLGGLTTAPLAEAGFNPAQSGASCFNSYPNEANLLYHSPTSGVSSTNTTTGTWVTCPLTRVTRNLIGGKIFVDVSHASSATTTCYGYSYDSYTRYLAGVTVSWAGIGDNEILLDLSGAGKSTANSIYTVACFIPANSKGYIRRFYLYEW